MNPCDPTICRMCSSSENTEALTRRGCSNQTSSTIVTPPRRLGARAATQQGCQPRASSKADAWREPVVASATGRRVAIGAGAHERGHPPLSLLLGERLQDRWGESARRWRVCACLL